MKLLVSQRIMTVMEMEWGGESYEGIVKVLQEDYPILFEIYKIL